MVINSCIEYHYRFWWLCRSRSSNCINWFCHRFKPRTILQARPTHTHASRWLWCCWCCWWHLQSSYCWRCFCHGSAIDGPHNDLYRTSPHCVGHSHCILLSFYGQRGYVPFRQLCPFHTRPHSLSHTTRCCMRTHFALFHSWHEFPRRYIPSP